LPRIADTTIQSMDAETIIKKLFETLAYEVVRLRRLAARKGSLTPDECKRTSLVARAVETCAQAKRHIIEATKAEDLSGIPTEQLTRVVVSQMRKLPELHAAVVAEINRTKGEEKPA